MSFDSYLTHNHLNSERVDMLPRHDGIIFDCDGVLVDVAESYYATIVQTARHVWERLGMRDMLPLKPNTIQTLKDTGAFNNEIDLTYVATIMGVSSARAHTNIDMDAAFADCHGIQDAERIAASIHNIDDVMEMLAYPGPGSMVQSIFDQIFYGPELYKKISGAESEFHGPGLIEREHILLDDVTQKWLTKRFDTKIGMVTGRGQESARYTLGSILDMFNMAGSVFLEDEPRHMAKPNPESLIAAIDAMGIHRCIYVGDSAEDLMMARATDYNVTFVGVWGTAPDQRRRQEMFLNKGADYMVRLITELPRILR